MDRCRRDRKIQVLKIEPELSAECGQDIADVCEEVIRVKRELLTNLFLGFDSYAGLVYRLLKVIFSIQNILLPKLSRWTMSDTVLRGGPAFGSTAGRPMGMTATAS